MSSTTISKYDRSETLRDISAGIVAANNILNTMNFVNFATYGLAAHHAKLRIMMSQGLDAGSSYTERHVHPADTCTKDGRADVLKERKQ